MCSVGTTSVRLSWRNALRHRWVKLIPRASRGQLEWRSLAGDFTGFMLYLGDMADDDGTNLRTPPCRDTIAAFVRCSKETVRRFYEAGEAAGLLFLRRDQGGRISGYRLLMPFGDRPNWRACLDVLRADARRVNQQAKRERERERGSSARADKCVRVHSSAREDELTPNGAADSSARDDDTGPHVTSRLSARADTTRVTRTDTGMAEVVETATTPRARAPYDGPPPTLHEDPPAHRRPRHPVAVPRPRSAPDPHPAAQRFTSDGHPVIRPGTPEWEDFRANLRAARGPGPGANRASRSRAGRGHRRPGGPESPRASASLGYV